MDNSSRFNGISDIYRKYRPKYSKQVIEYLINECILNNSSSVADIGCGTGIFTKQLLENGINVVGIEPNVEMYNQAKDYLMEHNFSLINSSAENTLLPSNSIDLITVAQALHWFNLRKFITESKRILKDNGRVAIIYNNYLKDNSALMDVLRVIKFYSQSYGLLSKKMNNQLDIYKCMIGENNFESKSYENDLLLSYEEFIGFINSMSYSLKPQDLNYEKYIKSLSDVFYKYSIDGKIYFTMITTVSLSLEKCKLRKRIL